MGGSRGGASAFWLRFASGVELLPALPRAAQAFLIRASKLLGTLSAPFRGRIREKMWRYLRFLGCALPLV